MPKKICPGTAGSSSLAAPLSRRYGGLVEAHAIQPRHLGSRTDLQAMGMQNLMPFCEKWWVIVHLSFLQIQGQSSTLE